MKTFLPVVGLMWLVAAPAYAHPPSDIQAKISGTQVEIVVTHNVENPLTHHIKHIGVKLNGSAAVDQNYTTQTDQTAQKAVYLIPSLKKGDKLTIDAECVMFGSKTVTVTVE